VVLVACATSSATTPSSTTPEIETFDDSAVGPATSGCRSQGHAIKADATSHLLNKSASDLAQQFSRIWNASLTWHEGAKATGDARLTLQFTDITKTEDVIPNRDPSAQFVNEAPCEAYVELHGMLSLRTEDGLLDVRTPASLQVHASGGTVISMNVAQGELPSTVLDPNDSTTIRLFTELTENGAAGEISSVNDDGTRATIASWR